MLLHSPLSVAIYGSGRSGIRHLFCWLAQTTQSKCAAAKDFWRLWISTALELCGNYTTPYGVRSTEMARSSQIAKSPNYVDWY